MKKENKTNLNLQVGMRHLALLLAQIVIRLRRQVYFYLNITSELPSALQLTWKSNPQTTFHSSSVKQQLLKSRWLHLGAKIQPSSPFFFFPVMLQKGNQQVLEDCEKRIHSVKHFLPFFLPPTVKKNRGLAWLQEPCETHSIDIHWHSFIAMHGLWAELKYAQIAYSDQCSALCTSPYFSLGGGI